jgi:hypothetical protein
MSGPFGILILIGVGGIIGDGFARGLMARLGAVGAVVALFFDHWAAGALFLLPVICAAKNGRLKALSIAAFAGAFCIALAWHKALFVLLLVACLGTLVATALFSRLRLEAAAAAATVAVLITAVIPAGWAPEAAGVLFGGQADAQPERYEKTVSINISGGEAFLEAAGWAGENVAEGKVVMIPPWWEGFRIASGGPVFGTYKDGTLVFFDEELAGEWLARMALLDAPLSSGGGSRFPAAGKFLYGALDEDDILRAAERFPVDYVVRRNADLAGFRHVYHGVNVHIYEVPRTGVDRE